MSVGKMIGLCVGLLCVCGIALAQEAEPEPVIAGTASYRERIALPPEAAFEAMIADISGGGVPADVLGGIRLEPPGEVPIQFEIPYDVSRIQEGHRYGVKARITVDGRTWFATDRFYPVLTEGHSNRVELMLTRMPVSPRGGTAPEAAGLGALPASFEGELPAADGPRIQVHLDLFPGRIFVWRMTKPGRERPPLDEIGTWAVSADGGRLMLQGTGIMPRLFSIEDGAILHTLDAMGREIEPLSSYDFTRLESFAPVEPRLLLRGRYGRVGDAGVFQECLTGWRLPVVQEGDGAALESAYSRASRESGEPLFVTLAGRIVPRPRGDGAGMEMVLVAERFIGAWPGETCGRRGGETPFGNADGGANSGNASSLSTAQ